MAQFLATGPSRKIVLHGRVVTMDADSQVIDDGYVGVEDDRIAFVAPRQAGLPDSFAETPVVHTEGSIFPGLVELHNHLGYNFLPLWAVPQKYTDRNTWRTREPDYALKITKPVNIIGRNLAKDYPRSIVRFVECRSLFGGVTTSQGIGSNRGFYSGLVRNVEAPGDAGLTAAGSQTLDYGAGQIATELVPALARGKPFFYHLSEGTDDRVRKHFLDLQYEPGKWAIARNLIPIHCVALQAADFARIAEAAGFVWSPLSNLLLYGETAKVGAAHAEGVKIALGSDWSPSGSKNLLGELKIARIVSEELGGLFPDRELVRMATSNPAEMLGWGGQLGSIEAGKKADLAIVRGTTGDPYLRLIEARENDIVAVLINGRPRLGRADLLTLDPARQEVVRVGGETFYLDLVENGADPLAGLSLATAVSKLSEGLRNLPEVARNFVADMRLVARSLVSDSVRLEFELEEEPGSFLRAAAAIEPAQLVALELEPLTEVDDPDFRAKLRANRNIPDYLREAL